MSFHSNKNNWKLNCCLYCVYVVCTFCPAPYEDPNGTKIENGWNKTPFNSIDQKFCWFAYSLQWNITVFHYEYKYIYSHIHNNVYWTKKKKYNSVYAIPFAPARFPIFSYIHWFFCCCCCCLLELVYMSDCGWNMCALASFITKSLNMYVQAILYKYF